MKIPPRIRALARRGRSILFPMGGVKSHFNAITRQTGRDLGFEAKVVQQLATFVEETLQESGVQQ